jgi:uncharacterized integral membrane protein
MALGSCRGMTGLGRRMRQISIRPRDRGHPDRLRVVDFCTGHRPIGTVPTSGQYRSVRKQTIFLQLANPLGLRLSYRDANVLEVPMRTRTLLVVLVLLLIVAFLATNWSVFAASAKVSFVFASIEVPIGLVMLGILTLIALTFGIYSAVSWSAILLEFRRQAKELTAQRTLADQAEASRFTELRAVMHDELERLADRMSQMHDTFRTEIRDNTNSLAATIGELDDRIQKLHSGDRPA